MATAKESKMKPGEFKFIPFGDWICIDKIDILSKADEAANRMKLGIVGGPTPKSIIELENKKAQEYVTYMDYTEGALKTFGGKHGHQGIVKAIGPLLDSAYGV